MIRIIASPENDRILKSIVRRVDLINSLESLVSPLENDVTSSVLVIDDNDRDFGLRWGVESSFMLARRSSIGSNCDTMLVSRFPLKGCFEETNQVVVPIEQLLKVSDDSPLNTIEKIAPEIKLCA